MPSEQAPKKTPINRKLYAKTPGRSTKTAVLLGLVVLLLASGGIAYYLSQRDNNSGTSVPNEPTATTEFPKPKPITYEETVTPNAHGQFMSVALEIFWSGGNANGTDIPGHNYYPSGADVNDEAWAKTNLKLHDDLVRSLKAGTLVYLPSGCKADKPSSEQNKCTSFSIQADGKEVAKSKN